MRGKDFVSRCRSGRHTHDFVTRCVALPALEAGADTGGEIHWPAASAFLRFHASANFYPFAAPVLGGGAEAVGPTRIRYDAGRPVTAPLPVGETRLARLRKGWPFAARDVRVAGTERSGGER